MDPNSILMQEHKIIEQMIYFLKKFSNQIDDFQSKNLFFLDLVINFFRIYADKNHHGKEENILFKRSREKLEKKEDIDLLDQLIEEHKKGRTLISKLESAKNKQDLTLIKKIINEIIELYTQHIKKENILFFPLAFSYFSEHDKEMLDLEFLKVSQRVLDNQYLDTVKNLLHFLHE